MKSDKAPIPTSDDVPICDDGFRLIEAIALLSRFGPVAIGASKDEIHLTPAGDAVLSHADVARLFALGAHVSESCSGCAADDDPEDRTFSEPEDDDDQPIRHRFDCDAWAVFV